MLQKLNTLFLQCVRVWHVLRKPSALEYTTVAKVSAVGLLVLGLLGFIISLLMKFIV